MRAKKQRKFNKKWYDLHAIVGISTVKRVQKRLRNLRVKSKKVMITKDTYAVYKLV